MVQVRWPAGFPRRSGPAGVLCKMGQGLAVFFLRRAMITGFMGRAIRTSKGDRALFYGGCAGFEHDHPATLRARPLGLVGPSGGTKALSNHAIQRTRGQLGSSSWSMCYTASVARVR